MKIILNCSPKITEELKQKLGSAHDLMPHSIHPESWVDADLIFDDAKFISSDVLQLYFKHYKRNLILNGTTQSMASLLAKAESKIQCNVIGMSLIPGFIHRDYVEWSAYTNSQKPNGELLAEALHWDIKWIEDRVGMVSPRIVCMIINEACFTLQEKTASVEDIDIGMKLGTNYPLGPFAWADKLGLETVYTILEALYQDTHDERYKICPLLKSMYLRKETFYV